MELVYVNTAAQGLLPEEWFGKRCFEVFPVADQTCAFHCPKIDAVSAASDSSPRVAYCEETLYQSNLDRVVLGVGLIPLSAARRDRARAVFVLRKRDDADDPQAFESRLVGDAENRAPSHRGPPPLAYFSDGASAPNPSPSLAAAAPHRYSKITGASQLRSRSAPDGMERSCLTSDDATRSAADTLRGSNGSPLRPRARANSATASLNRVSSGSEKQQRKTAAARASKLSDARPYTPDRGPRPRGRSPSQGQPAHQPRRPLPRTGRIRPGAPVGFPGSAGVTNDSIVL